MIGTDIITRSCPPCSLQDHLGIISADVRTEISKTAPYGVYHSIYDSMSWMENFGDPTFEYHKVG